MEVSVENKGMDDTNIENATIGDIADVIDSKVNMNDADNIAKSDSMSNADNIDIYSFIGDSLIKSSAPCFYRSLWRLCNADRLLPFLCKAVA